MKIHDLKTYSKQHDLPLVVLTAYTAPMSRILQPFVDFLLVGDSLGMVLYGMNNTREVTLELMKAHGKAVCKAGCQATREVDVIIDMPFGTYTDADSALNNARTLIDATGAAAVKLEGGVEIAPIIQKLTHSDIDVIGHIGLQPQSVTSDFKAKGRQEDEAAQILADAHAVQESGAMAVVIEAVMEPLARQITQEVTIPTIGIGASPACDGQVLVSEDMLGYGQGPSPRFVKKYADLESQIAAAAGEYADEVRSRIFPSEKHLYKARAKIKNKD